jgi:hypothetical protein
METIEMKVGLNTAGDKITFLDPHPLDLKKKESLGSRTIRFSNVGGEDVHLEFSTVHDRAAFNDPVELTEKIKVASGKDLEISVRKHLGLTKGELYSVEFLPDPPGPAHPTQSHGEIHIEC